MELTEALAIFACALGATFIGTLSGFGFALLIVPPLSFVIGAKDAVVLSNALGFSWLVTMFTRLRADVAWGTAIPLTIAAFAGMPLGLLILEVASQRTLQLILAVNVLAAVLLIWRGVVLPFHGRAFDAVAGFVSGILNTSTSMNGPPIVIHLQNRGMAAAPFRATIAAVFVASSVLTLALYAVGGRLDGEVFQRVGVGLPGLAIGYLAGSVVVRRLDQAQFRRVVMGVLVASAVMVFARALTA